MGKIRFTQFNRFRPEPRPIAEAFWEKAKILSKDECWEWLAHIKKDGYGGFKGGLAHRFAWEISYGRIPAGMYVCHKCDNPPCVNPSHLFLGTQYDNMKDMIGKGRIYDRSGENNPKTKLSNKDIVDIYRAYNSGKTQRSIAKNYNISQATIYYIVRGKTWKNLFEQYEHTR